MKHRRKRAPLSWWLLAAGLAAATGSITTRGASPAVELARQLNQAFIEVAETASASVVVISVAHSADYLSRNEEENPYIEMLPEELREQFKERQERQRQRRQRRGPVFDGKGSGVVIRADGYILTNGHVVEGAEKIKVKFKDGKQYAAVVRGVDRQSDIAVLKIEGEGKSFPAAKLGDSAKTRVGEFAIAIGAPLDLDYSVTFGHVSAKGRTGVIPGYQGGGKMDQDFIQTDASINPGNSGGPLVNLDGEVIGINTLIRGLHTGIGFAVPVNLAREVAEQLISTGKFARARLGVAIRSLADVEDFRTAQGLEQGVLIDAIDPAGPAAQSELRPGDIVVAVNGRPVAFSQQLKDEIRSKPVGVPVTLDVVRRKQPLQVKVSPGPWPDEEPALAAAAPKPRKPEAAMPATVGLKVQALTKELAKQFKVPGGKGVLVAEVETGSLAEEKRIQAGDVIVEVNYRSVTSPKEFQDALKRADLKQGILLNVITDQGVNRTKFLKDGGD
jgi:serine protease Do